MRRPRHNSLNFEIEGDTIEHMSETWSLLSGRSLLSSARLSPCHSRMRRKLIPLLHDLKARFGLDYRLLVNTEPHMRAEPGTGVLYEGSVGKIDPRERPGQSPQPGPARIDAA